jgi:hypothetical protein
MYKHLETRLDEIDARLAQIAGMLQLVLNTVAIEVPRRPHDQDRNWPPTKGDLVL